MAEEVKKAAEAAGDEVEKKEPVSLQWINEELSKYREIKEKESEGKEDESAN